MNELKLPRPHKIFFYWSPNKHVKMLEYYAYNVNKLLSLVKRCYIKLMELWIRTSLKCIIWEEPYEAVMPLRSNDLLGVRELENRKNIDELEQ